MFEHPQDPAAVANASFERWLEEHKSLLSGQLAMPVIDDYILVVAFRDLASDKGGGFATLKTVGSAAYRIRGLLEVALDFYSAHPFGPGQPHGGPPDE
jgi:hypothetical protein